MNIGIHLKKAGLDGVEIIGLVQELLRQLVLRQRQVHRQALVQVPQRHRHLQVHQLVPVLVRQQLDNYGRHTLCRRITRKKTCSRYCLKW